MCNCINEPAHGLHQKLYGGTTAIGERLFCHFDCIMSISIGDGHFVVALRRLKSLYLAAV